MRFVVLLHNANDGGHYDLLLENEKHLLAWKIDSYPPRVNERIEAVKNFPHRKFYIDYEGELSNNRGWIERVDEGIFKLISDNEIFLEGKNFSGNLRFEFPFDTKKNSICYIPDDKNAP